MEKDLFQKIVGIIIVVALAGSMLAGAFIWLPDITTPTQNIDNINTNQTIFEYEINFETSVIQELDSIRMAAETKEIDKTKIDLEIQKIEGISRIQTSEFRTISEGRWFYFLEVSLRRNSNIEKIVEEIFSLDFFEGEKQAMKRISITTPKEKITLENLELDLSRNFLFEFPTTFALAEITTLPNDQIIVSGKISLQGNNIVFIELVEIENKTDLPIYFNVEKEFDLISLGEELFFEVQGDFNKDYYSEQVSLLENSYAFPYNEKIIGQTSIQNLDFIQELFLEFDLELTREGIIFIENLFIEELDKEFFFGKELSVEVQHNSNINEKINFELTISKTRSAINVVNGKEIA